MSIKLKFSLAFLIIFLASCASTPKINLLRSAEMGMEMQLNQPAPWVLSTLFSPEGRYILSLSDPFMDDTLRLWDVKTGKLVRQFKGETTQRAAAFSPDDRYIILGSSKGELKLFDVETGVEIRAFAGHTKPIASVAFSPEGRYALSGSWDKTLKLWEISTGRELRTFRGHTGWINSIAFSPDGRYGLSGGRDKTLKLWEISTGKELRTFRGHKEPITSIAFSPDGRYAVSGGDSSNWAGDTGTSISLWEISTGRRIRTFKGHARFASASLVHSVAFSPCGKYVLSGGADGTLRLRDIDTAKEIRTFKGHAGGMKNNIYSVAFSPDGKFVISGSHDSSTRIWDSSTGQEIAMFVGFKEGEWIVITPEGYYNSSAKGHQYLTVKVGDNTYDVEKFYDVFYRPDIVAAKLSGEDIKDLITITMQHVIKTPPPMVEINPIPSVTTEPKMKVCYRVKGIGGGIGEVRIFHNGKLIQSDGYYKDMAKSSSHKAQLAALNSRAIYEDMRGLMIKGKTGTMPITSKFKGDPFADCKELEAIPGENQISITAFNSNNTVQGYMKTINFTSRIFPEEPHLYILSIAIDQYKDNTVNLKYAVKDAKDIEEKLKAQSATLYKPQNIHCVLLTDTEATKSNIFSKIDELTRVIKPHDNFILFLAGHGVLLQNQYYLLTHDYNASVNENSMISSNEIVEMSKKIKSLGQLFIFDTCHAGGVDYILSGLYDARMSVLAKKMGLHIYASASDKQAAMDGYRGNGLFTYTLLEGLNNNKEADRNNDRKVSLVELGGYSRQTTANISKEIGHSQTPLIINFGRDNPIYQLK